MAHLHQKPLPMKEANPDVHVPAQVEQVVMSCLEKDPDFVLSRPGSWRTGSGRRSRESRRPAHRLNRGRYPRCVCWPLCGTLGRRLDSGRTGASPCGAAPTTPRRRRAGKAQSPRQ